jgi:predicted negative regulator of RcsB-dependent stress response
MAIGVLLIMLSSGLVWIEAPIRGGAHPGSSFGWMAVLIGAIACVAWFRRSGWLLTTCAMSGLGLCSFSVQHLTALDPVFWPLVDENAQYANIMHFSRAFLPANYGIEPTFEANLLTETVQDRLATAFYFMGSGWWICFGGALLLLVGSCKGRDRQMHMWTAMATVMIFGVPGIMLLNGIAAQYLQEKGDRYMARSLYAEAIQQYEAAQRFDPQLARSERMHLQLGKAYDQLKIAGHPHRRFYLGDLYSQRGQVEAAIAEYLVVDQEASTLLKEIVRKRLAWTYVKLGQAQYHKREIGPAIGCWEKALNVDSAQMQAAYFLSRAYFEQSRYEQSIAIGLFLLSLSHNPLLNANVQANIGDSYWRLNDFKSARQAYAASMRLDAYTNFRMLKSLGGT